MTKKQCPLGEACDLTTAWMEAQAAEIERLAKDKRWIINERDRTFALMLSRAEKAEAKLAKAVDALQFYAWENNEARLPSDGPWGAGSTDFGNIARTTLAEIKGENHD